MADPWAQDPARDIELAHADADSSGHDTTTPCHLLGVSVVYKLKISLLSAFLGSISIA